MTFLSPEFLRYLSRLPARARLLVSLLAARASRRDQLRREAPRAPWQDQALSAAQAEACGALKRDGVFVTDLESLGLPGADTRRLLEDGASAARAMAARAASGADRPAVVTSEASDLLAFPGVYRWGLSLVLLDIAEALFELPVGYDGPLIFHTATDPAESGTRRWHMDREDPEVLRIGVYLNDVGPAGGPFQILRREEASAVRISDYRALTTEQLETRLGVAISPGMARSCEGPAGTVVMAMTGRRYHRGAPATETERSAVFYSYFPRPPRHPGLCGRPGLSRAQVVQLTENMSRAQRRCALWQDKS